MPRSVVIYASAASLSALKESIRLRFGHERRKPYTLSYDQKTDAGKRRLRLCELADDALLPMIGDLVAKGEATFGGPSDGDVESRSYEELLEDADRRRRVAVLQFSTPVIVEVSGAARAISRHARDLRGVHRRVEGLFQRGHPFRL